MSIVSLDRVFWWVGCIICSVGSLVVTASIVCAAFALIYALLDDFWKKATAIGRWGKSVWAWNRAGKPSEVMLAEYIRYIEGRDGSTHVGFGTFLTIGKGRAQ